MAYVEKVQGGSSVSWGGMLAGAAAVTGGVLLASSVMGADTFGEAVEAIKDKFTSDTPESLLREIQETSDKADLSLQEVYKLGGGVPTEEFSKVITEVSNDATKAFVDLNNAKALVAGDAAKAAAVVGSEVLASATEEVTGYATQTADALEKLKDLSKEDSIEKVGGTLKEFGNFLKNNGKELAGAALVGGGAAGIAMNAGDTTTHVVASQHPLQLAHSHVENEQMRAINGLMKARMMAANPEYMAQAMGRA